MRKPLLALLAVIVLAGLGLFLWARAVLTQDAVRAALAAQLAHALGQPVTVGGISATIYPRVTVTLGSVSIGEPPGVQIASLHVETDLRALLSRRIEHASARVEGATIQLPLIPLGRATGESGTPDTAPAGVPVALVSIDEIVLSGVELVSAGRTLRGDIEVVPEGGRALTLRRASLHAGDASFEATGRITDLRGPVGELTITAGELNLDRLLAFFNDFAGAAMRGDPGGGRAAGGAPGAVKPDLNAALDSSRAWLAGIALDRVAGRAHVTDAGVLLKPIAFGMFGGTFAGALHLQPAADHDVPAFGVSGAITGVDFPAVTSFGGAETEPITGRLSAQIELTGIGADMAAALRSMHGTARVELANGIVRNLGLVRAIVIATSMRGAAATVEGAGAAASAEAAMSRDEPFETLRATLAVAGRSATTNDLEFEGENVSMTARGTIALDGRAVELTGRVQLSDELTARAGTDLVRLTRERGRVTLPVTISGPAAAMSAQIDASALLQRAIRNVAEDELRKAIIKGLGGVLKKPLV